MSENYLKIVRHYENCFDRFGDQPKGVDWPNEEGALIRYKVMHDLVKEKGSPTSILDFGCGLAHFHSYLQSSGVQNIEYAGLDLSEKFVSSCRKKYPNLAFYCGDIFDPSFNLPTFDYLILNGVLTEKLDLTHDEMWNFAQNLLVKAFSFCRKGMAFNVMSKNVDWERDDLFHLSTDQLTNFVFRKLSRNFVIRNDYGLYEYTTYVYR